MNNGYKKLFYLPAGSKGVYKCVIHGYGLIFSNLGSFSLFLTPLISENLDKSTFPI